MKKILLATTVLAMSAGFAAADVAVSGSARMGIVSTDGDTIFSSRVRVSFSGSGTTDGGLAFGGSIRADNAVGGNAGTAGSTFISGAFGKISMGDVSSGDNAAVGQLSSVGYQGLGSGNSISYAADGGSVGLGDDSENYSGADGAKVLYTYSAGALSVNASSAQLSNGPANHQAYGLGVSYTAGAATLAVGYGTNEISEGEDTGSITDVSASAKYVMGATTIKAIYQDKSADVGDVNVVSATSMGMSVDHKIDALTLTGYAISTSVTSDVIEIDASFNRQGIGASYDLGGGATFAAGWANIDVLNDDDSIGSQSAFDAGVNFSF
jgi:outer membrane protein OmpU